jgi:hypothetical protein
VAFYEKAPSLYDIEELAYSALSSIEDSDEFIPLKDYSVNNPDKPLPLIKIIASWVVRDDYEKERFKKEEE